VGFVVPGALPAVPRVIVSGAFGAGNGDRVGIVGMVWRAETMYLARAQSALTRRGPSERLNPPQLLMHPIYRRFLALGGLSILAALLASTGASAANGVAVIDSLIGAVEVAAPAGPIQRGEAIDPNGLIFTTGPGDSAALAFSNGVALYLGPNSRLEVERYEQAPFTSQPDNRRFEPGRSQLALRLEHGELAIAAREANPLSILSVDLGAVASVTLRSESAYLAVDANASVVAPMEGAASIDYREREHLVREDYRFAIAPGGTGAPDPIREHRVDEAEAWSAACAKAELVRDRWFFKSPAGDDSIQIVPIAPVSKLTQKPFNATKL